MYVLVYSCLDKYVTKLFVQHVSAGLGLKVILC